jgi:glycosidase
MAQKIPSPEPGITRFEFHLAARVRQTYQFNHLLFPSNGTALQGDYRTCQLLVEPLNTARKATGGKPVSAGQLNALGLLKQIFHLVFHLYRQQIKPQVMKEAIDWLESRLGERSSETVLHEFTTRYPPIAVHDGKLTPREYLDEKSGETQNHEIALEELLMLWLGNINPAAAPLRELIDDRPLDADSPYSELIKQLDDFFHYQPAFGPENQQLIAMLRSPATASPDSLRGQLEFIYSHWSDLLGDALGDLLKELLVAIDLLDEEESHELTGSPGPVEPYEYRSRLQDSPVRFSPDSNWMPSVVLLAKNSFVWLDQLSKKYQRSIERLDQIPDEELDLLANQGITGLWLIGLWQRSRASRTIKQMMGDPDAIASAYSLDDYRIADELGGGEAVENLRQRAWQRGIRLASDMVPNHMGIDSRWVIEHPNWFLSLEYCPYPSYSFTGPNLSQREDIGIFIEDKYYNRSDAAVVFKRVNFHSGEERYIYHGNDGTFLPWNDTAQLDFSKAEVREGVIQTILHVARQFPIIRFDAAMTLAKQHIQRLWFPPPGQGGAIPSRAGRGMTEDEFDRAIPEEFWREVVDRVASEAPDTLLLAEAFWMMEGYFVRTLGMHRVYNSAFMHMLRDESNKKYRQLIKNTLDFDPQILKRYVNFMSNPDEETAAGQFGKGDKYFGVAIVMATMPGLPMIGHGQIEGFVEKYGMEFKRAKLEEKVDQSLYERHRQLIFPLFHRRKLFAEVENFYLYDLFTDSGYVNEEVLAYSNRLRDQRALVVYHNRFGDSRGWIKTSVAYKDSNGNLTQRSLGEGLDLPNDPSSFVIFRDHVSNREYLRRCSEIHEYGLFVELYAYQANVFLDFRIVKDIDGSYRKLSEYLNGRPVDSIAGAMEEMVLQTILMPFRELVDPGLYRSLFTAQETRNAADQKAALSEVGSKSEALLKAISEFTEIKDSLDPVLRKIKKLAAEQYKMPDLTDHYPYPRGRKYKQLAQQINQQLQGNQYNTFLLYSYLFCSPLGKLAQPRDYGQVSAAWFRQWQFGKLVQQIFQQLDFDLAAAAHAAGMVHLLIDHMDWFKIKVSSRRKPLLLLHNWLEDPEIRRFLGVNQYEGIEWFNQQAMESWLSWVLTIGVLEMLSTPGINKEELPKKLTGLYDAIAPIQKAIPASEFQIGKLLALLKPGRKS